MSAMSDQEERLVDEVASVLANMTPEERAEIAKLLRKTPAELDRIIANWKAERMQ
jgi:hypothetical protein